MALTAEQHRARIGKLTASQVGILMGGDEAKILNLWKNLVGDPTYQSVDLSGVWPVRLGEVTEELQLNWYERKRNTKVTRRGEVVVMKGYDWAAATLDGWDDTISIPIECKHVGGRESLERVIERYMPQVHWQMLVCDTDMAVMSIIEGANEPLLETIEFHEEYGQQLWKRALAFMNCVNTLTPPSLPPAILPPDRVVKTYDMTGKNAWASFAVEWLNTKSAANDNAKATKSIKALMPSDGIRAHGHGIEITRDRAGRLSLRAA